MSLSRLVPILLAVGIVGSAFCEDNPAGAPAADPAPVAAPVAVAVAVAPAAKAKPARVAVDQLPEAVRATLAKEGGVDVKEMMKAAGKDGAEIYRARITGADGQTVVLTIAADGSVVSKKEGKNKKNAKGKDAAAGGAAPIPSGAGADAPAMPAVEPGF